VNEETKETLLLSLGINPKNNEPYIHSPKNHYEKEKTFLDRWWDDLSPETKDRFKEIELERNNVVASGFSDEQGRDYIVDDKGFIHPKVASNVSDDPVEKPAHYRQGNIEAVDYLKDNLPVEAFIGGCEWNVKKYLHRWRYKGKPLEDLKKARWYLDLWITTMEGK
jgi:hypothetical protein